MSIRAKHAHFTNWAKVCEAINNVMVNNVKVNNVSTDEEARTFLTTTNDGSMNPFYYMVCYIKSTKEIYTHGVFYSSLQELYDDISEITESLETLSTNLTTLTNEVSENELVWAKALSDLHENKADKSEIPTNISDLTNDLNLITEDELNVELTTKQNLLISGSNIKTFNGVSLLGKGDLSSPPLICPNIRSGSITVNETLIAQFTYIPIPQTTGNITLTLNSIKGLNNDFEHEWHIFIDITSISHSLSLTNRYNYPIIWTNGAVPVFDSGNMYEIHIKHIPNVNKLFAICTSYPLS